MKKTVKRSALVSLMAAGIIGVGGFAAAQAAPDALPEAAEKPSAGGSAVAPDDTHYTIDDTGSEGDIAPLDTANVGGGTWNYGSYLGVTHPKTCYSNYKHNGKYHSSAAIIANSNVTRYASAGYWSNASTWAGAAYTCNTYWNTY